MKAANHELNTDQRIYLIKFCYTLTDGNFFTTDLGKTIKEHDQGRGIDYIKVFDTAKNKFTRISKKDILQFHSWQTESFEILKAYNYFK